MMYNILRIQPPCHPDRLIHVIMKDSAIQSHLLLGLNARYQSRFVRIESVLYYDSLSGSVTWLNRHNERTTQNWRIISTDEYGVFF